MLVPVPWQPALYVHADLLVKLQAVQARMGRPPLLFGPNSGWRSYDAQKALYDAWLAGKGNPASNPDTGNRTHMRGVAADLADYSPAKQRALRAVALERDPAEAWHWQLTDWRTYPIIPTMPKPDQEIDVKLIRREGTTPEWSLFHPSLRGPSQGERGYLVITDAAIARDLARTWAEGFGTEKSEPRDVYVGLQNAAKWAWDRNVQPVGGVDLTPVLTAIDGVPTAAENGAAARKAIVA